MRVRGVGSGQEPRVVVFGAQAVVGEELVRGFARRGMRVRGVLEPEGESPERVDAEIAWEVRRAGRGVRAQVRDAQAVVIDAATWLEGEVSVCVALRQLRDVMDASAEVGVSRVVVLTSAATVGEGRNEGGLFTPRGDVGASWDEVAWAIEAECYRYMLRGVPVMLGLPAAVVGMRRVGVFFSRWVSSVHDVGEVRGVSVVDARDVARAVVMMFERGKVGRRYLLCGELVEASWVRERGGLRGGAACVLEGSEAMLGREYDIERARGELGFRPRRWEVSARELGLH